MQVLLIDMQQIYPKKQRSKTVVHIQIQQFNTPTTPLNQSKAKNTPKLTSSPPSMKMTRSTFYVLKDQNNNSTMSLDTTHRQVAKSQQTNRRKASAQNRYGSFTKSSIYSQIFTQPISKLNKTYKSKQRRSYSQASELYDKIKVFNQNMITKQYNFQQNNIQIPNKMRTIHSRNCSSSNTQQIKVQTQKKQLIQLKFKPKPWQVRKKGFYLAYSNKKMKNENEKYSFRCLIDPWEIIDRDDPQY